MSEHSTTANRIIDIASKYIKNKGYNAFSFRDVATEMGIKSASVHYHFPTKADLTIAVMQRYCERFIAKLGSASSQSIDPRVLLKKYIFEFKLLLLAEDNMCLGGVLAAEINSLPTEVADATHEFFAVNLKWLSAVLQRMFPEKDKEMIKLLSFRLLAILEGTLILNRSLNEDIDVDLVIDGLVELH